MPAAALPVVDVLGVDVAVGTLDSAADAVIARALSGEGGYAVCCNVHVLMTARDRPDVMDSIRYSWAVLPDGAPVAWMQRRHGHEKAERIGGPDLMPMVLDRGRECRLRHALVGSTQMVVDRLRHEIEEQLPGVRIVRAIAPDPGSEEDESVFDDVHGASPQIVWLALGAPKQELWMRRHASRLSPALVIGVGAAFDFHAGTKQRAPAWMRRSGLEWAHRLGSEPRRLGMRYLTTNTAFVVSAAWRLAHRKTAS